MKDFTYSYPTHVYFGKGALANALKPSCPSKPRKCCWPMAAAPSRKTASTRRSPTCCTT